MNLQAKRWLLAPARQWRTHRIMAQHGPALPYETAWALITLHDVPEEAPFVRARARHHHLGEAGLYYDDWRLLSRQERVRRNHWLQRYGRTPLQRLGVDEALIQAAGLRVVDWGRPVPAEHDGQPPKQSPEQ